MTMQKRTKQIIIRVTQDEFNRLNELKARPELARWIREEVLKPGNKKMEKVRHELPPDLIRTVAGIGNNLNQIARNINSIVKVGAMNQVDAITVITQLAATEQALNAVRNYLESRS